MTGVKRAIALFVVYFAVPSLASAQVVINELMYNPQGADTGREWIELYNSGASDVTLVGGTVKGSWRINDGSSHTLTDPSGGVGRGSLTIPAGEYLIISNDPSSFLGEYSSGSYSVVKSSISLSNTAATISLLDGTGATVDKVSYTKDQGAYDDGTSLQREADGSWITALPTPGAPNSITAYIAPSSDTSSTNTSNTSASSSQANSSSQSATPSYVAPPVPSIYANAGSDKTVIVGADAVFDASAYDKSSQPITNNVRFSWNFGDGGTAEGESVLHHFNYPGKYAVVLSIAQDKSAASDELVVTAEPAALSFEMLGDGGVSIDNKAGHDLDLSGWIVRESESPFAHQFMLPEHSRILGGASMRIAAATLGYKAASSTMLEYPNGTLALSMGASTARETTPVQASAAAAPTLTPEDAPKKVTHTKENVPDQSPDTRDTPSVQDPAPSTDATSSQVAAAEAGASASSYLWWVGAFVLASAAAGAAVIAKRYARGEWDIIEESGD